MSKLNMVKRKPSKKTAKLMAEYYQASANDDLAIAKECEGMDSDFNFDGPLLEIIDSFGGVTEINRRAEISGNLDYLLGKVNEEHSYGITWLQKQIDSQKFVTTDEYYKNLGQDFKKCRNSPVTLEISACNHVEWLFKECQLAIERKEIMPSRYIRVRNMIDQVEDDLIAFQASMKILGASSVQTLGTKGTMLDKDGLPVNVHLCGKDSIAGYFGGVGVPNGYALDWVKELLHYYTEYGILEVLNVNYGTVLLGLMLYKLGVNTKFKISVFLGIDNPYSALNIFMLSKMFSRSDGSCGLAGLNLSNSVNSDTIEKIADFRQSFGFEDSIRIEHHITEAYKGIVRQPYDRLDELLHLAGKVKNISAKHEGGVPQDEESLYHPSNITDYFLLKPEINKLMPQLEQNYLLKHGAVNRSAKALALQNLAFLGAPKLHF